MALHKKSEFASLDESLGVGGSGGVSKVLKKGFSTGACASAASKAAMLGFLRGEFPRRVEISLPRGERPEFAIERAGFLRQNSHQDSHEDSHPRGCYAVVRKDAGDDPDVTHGALILVSIEPHKQELLDSCAQPIDNKQTTNEQAAASSLQLVFRAGRGVGIVTLAGLPLAVGEPAINPAPRRMILANLQEAIEECKNERTIEPRLAHNSEHIFRVTISVASGVRLAERTWNARLGIIGGLSILGTTGIVVPYSCSAWIHAIHRGVDVARANGVSALAAATGRTSEQSVMRLLGLPQEAVIDMGDFAGGMLKYMRKQPVGCLTIAGGFGKMVKLAQGNSDLHSGRSSVDFTKLANLAKSCGGEVELCATIADAVSANEVLSMLEDNAATTVLREKLLRTLANKARDVALDLLAPTVFPMGIVLVARNGRVLTHLTAYE